MALARKHSNKTDNDKYELLRQFVPLNTLDHERLDELAKHASIKEIPANTKLFRRGDTDNQAIYLIGGEIDLVNSEESTSISPASEQARLAIDPHQPRQYTAISRTESRVLILEQNLLDIILTWDPYAGYVVDEIEASGEHHYDDWMLATLQSEIFQRIPPANIQSMFQKLESHIVVKDEIIFRQGDTGDYFYIIQSGRCCVIRERNNAESIIVELNTGSSFGEDALLSSNPRNATIRMLTDGRLLRLSKDDFNELFKSNIVVTIDPRKAFELTAKHGVWIDVRQPEEFKNQSIPNSFNIPLPLIRESLHRIPDDQPVIIYCDTGQRSTCAAYLLSAMGYEAYVLQDGIQVIASDRQSD